MLVYRVEHKKTGTGPYVSCKLPQEARYIASQLNSAHSCSSDHPVVVWDMIDGGEFKFQRNMYCGFPSIERLLKWFGGFTPQLGRHGFVIRVYEANSVFFTASGLQIAFRKAYAKPVKTILL